MVAEEFNKLSEEMKSRLIFDANKITERKDGSFTWELFKIDNFFIEIKRCIGNTLKRVISTYSIKDLPLIYRKRMIALHSKKK
ncbi:MAG: hypothetical protein JWQ40_136 [Segetibacter sp.]|nr:hypothetical protein [Segetibacter sp.]